MPDFVFGYGSLTGLRGAAPARLSGHRRRWGVAMDNAVAIPGYKRYKASDGSWPAVAVAFLDLEPAQDATVNGALVRVGTQRLRSLDARERNYVRVDVTAWLAGDRPDGTVWAFLGRDDARARLHDARAAGTAVVAKRYVETVEAGFDALGPGELAAFRASTVPHGLPVRSLRRVPLPQPTADGRHLIIDGRRWRATDPDLPEADRRALVSELMSARSAVGHAKRRGDEDAVQAARARVQAAKVALGER